MIYDLSHTINEELPVYPGDPRVKIDVSGQLSKDGFNDHVLKIGTHNGTHIDAPVHMLENGRALSDYPVDRFVVQAVCIDMSQEVALDHMRQVIATAGMGVLFYTGTDDYFRSQRYWEEYPVLDPYVVDLLIEKQVSIVGIDTGSFDIVDGFPIHKSLLSADILLIENLKGLKPLIDKKFELFALPLKLGLDGAPARVIAVVD